MYVRGKTESLSIVSIYLAYHGGPCMLVGSQGVNVAQDDHAMPCPGQHDIDLVGSCKKANGASPAQPPSIHVIENDMSRTGLREQNSARSTGNACPCTLLTCKFFSIQTDIWC